MDQFFTVVLTSLIAATVSNVFIWWHKEKDYKRDYYKKIIDKRMDSYEKLQGFIRGIDIRHETNNGYAYECFESKEKLSKALQDFLSTVGFNIWLSDSIIIELEKMNKIFVESLAKIDKEKNKTVMEIGKVVFGELEPVIHAVAVNIGKDLNNLADVKSFLESKSVK